MTTTATAITPFPKHNSIISKPWPSDPIFLKLKSTPPTFQLLSTSLTHSAVRTEPIPMITRKFPAMKVSASLAQEEAAVSVTNEEQVSQEAVGVTEEEEQVSSGAGDEALAESAVNTKLYFGNLPYLCDSAQLAGIIQDYGSPELVEVLYNRDTGKSRGFAFVTMSSVEDCKAVIENLDGREYGGRTLRVNFSDKPKPKEPLYPETEFKLFVGNLSWSVTSESLTELFSEHGNVVGARVLYDGETGRSRGYGFVSYHTKAEMETALQILNGVEYGGRTLRVNFSDKPKPKEPLYPETEFKLFVGNLSWSVTSESLTELFSEHGNVVGARVLYDGETGRSRGYGFVSYHTKAEMETALQILNGVELEGRSIRVSLAQGKKQ